MHNAVYDGGKEVLMYFCKEALRVNQPGDGPQFLRQMGSRAGTEFIRKEGDRWQDSSRCGKCGRYNG